MVSKRMWWGLLFVLACDRGTPAASVERASAKPEPAAPTEVLGEAGTTGKPQGQAQPTLPQGRLTLTNGAGAARELMVEVATTDPQRQMGLMFRSQLSDQEGMLFAFPTERYNSFWMHNTLIPLDMLFVDSDWEVVGIVENAEPLTDSPRSVPRMSRYVLEVPGGFCARYEMGEGSRIQLVVPKGVQLP